MDKKIIVWSLLKTLVTFAVIIIVFLVIYRYVALNNWEDLWKALRMAKVLWSLSIATVFVLGVKTIYLISFSDSNDTLVPAGLTLWLCVAV